MSVPLSLLPQCFSVSSLNAVIAVPQSWLYRESPKYENDTWVYNDGLPTDHVIYDQIKGQYFVHFSTTSSWVFLTSSSVLLRLWPVHYLLYSRMGSSILSFIRANLNAKDVAEEGGPKMKKMTKKRSELTEGTRKKAKDRLDKVKKDAKAGLEASKDKLKDIPSIPTTRHTKTPKSNPPRPFDEESISVREIWDNSKANPILPFVVIGGFVGYIVASKFIDDLRFGIASSTSTSSLSSTNLVRRVSIPLTSEEQDKASSLSNVHLLYITFAFHFVCIGVLFPLTAKLMAPPSKEEQDRREAKRTGQEISTKPHQSIWSRMKGILKLLIWIPLKALVNFIWKALAAITKFRRWTFLRLLLVVGMLTLFGVAWKQLDALVVGIRSGTSSTSDSQDTQNSQTSLSTSTSTFLLKGYQLLDDPTGMKLLILVFGSFVFLLPVLMFVIVRLVIPGPPKEESRLPVHTRTKV